MNKVAYVLTNESDGEVVVVSTSKEKMIDFAVDYILDGISDEIEEEVGDDFDEEDGDEYEEEVERIEKDYKERITQWATDLVDGKNTYHCSDEFSYSFMVWISIVELI